MKLTITEIQEILPHRYPFLLLDSVEEVIPGERVVAKKNVTVNEQVFQGHFPGNPVLPGVLIIESLAQAGAWHYFQCLNSKGKRHTLVD